MASPDPVVRKAWIARVEAQQRQQQDQGHQRQAIAAASRNPRATAAEKRGSDLDTADE